MLKQTIQRLPHRGWASIPWYLLAVFCFAGVLLSLPPEGLTGAVRNGGVVVILLITLFLVPVFARQGLIGNAESFLLTLVLFALPLSWIWTNGYSDGLIIGGLLPWSDADDYQWGAERLLSGQYITGSVMKRPMFPGFLAFIHALTQGNLMVTLSVLAFLTALSVFLATREVQQTEGPLVAVVVMLVMFIFYRLHISGKIMTESMGLVFGSLGAGLLWRGTRTRQFNMFWWGILALTLGLIARAGAFLVLPALVLWGTWFYRGSSRISVKFFIMASSAVLAGFVLNYALGKIIGISGLAFGNFSWVVYGLVSGNKGWEQIFIDYPGMIIPQQEVYRFALDIFIENPWGLFSGIMGTYLDYSRAVFSFVWIEVIFVVVLYLLTGLGLLWCIKDRRNATSSMVLAVFAGILLSVPAVPPYDSMRVYAATIPFTAIVAGLGLTFLLQFRSRVRKSAAFIDPFSTGLLLPVSIGLVVFSFAGPIGVYYLNTLKETRINQQCPLETELLTLQIDRGSYINIVPDSTGTETFLPNLHISDFREGISGLSFYPELQDALRELRPGQSIYAYLNLAVEDTELAYLIANTIPASSIPGVFQFCAISSNNAFLKQYRFYYEHPAEWQENLSVPPPSFIQRYLWLGVVFLLIFIVAGSYWKLVKPTAVLVAQKEGSRRRQFVFSLLLVGLLPGIMMSLYVSGVFTMGWEKNTLDMTKSAPLEGHAYYLPVGTKWMSQTNTKTSPAQILEDGKPLPYPNALRNQIVETGEGRYSYWKGDLYLSASDNSDPRENGRTYEILWPTQPRSIVIWGVLGLTLAVMGLIIKQIREVSKILGKNGEEKTRLTSALSYKDARQEHWDLVASRTDTNRYWSGYYHSRLAEIYRSIVPPGQRVLEVGCGEGQLLSALTPAYGVGVDFSREMIARARQLHQDDPNLQFIQQDAHTLELDEKFDVIILSDLVNDLWDVQTVLGKLRKVCNPSSRVIINSYSRLWEIPLSAARNLELAKPVLQQNWLGGEDIRNLLYLENYETIRSFPEILWPIRTSVLDRFFNRFLVKLWPFRMFGLTNFVIARSHPGLTQGLEREPSVSVIIPARNEEGHVSQYFERMPRMGSETEIVFVEGHSQDHTYSAIEKAIKAHPEWKTQLHRQTGVGKGDAVRLGFAQASGDILMILDADLTVPPEDLPRFYQALSTEQGDFINGVRLVYPMEDEAMRFLNLLGNKFFSLAFSWLLGQAIKDTLCGTKVLWKRDYNLIVANRSYFGDFDPFGDFDLLFGAARLNLKIVDVPIRYRERTYGTTNISRWKHGWLLLRMVLFAATRIKFV